MENPSNNTTNVFMTALEWIMTLAYLNLLWVAFTLIGLFFFGIGPATISVFSLVRTKLRQGDLSHIFSKFKAEYKKHFKAGNICFWILAAVAAFLYVDIRIIQALPPSGFIQMVVLPALVALSALVIVTATFSIGYYLENNEPILTSIKQGFWVTLISPISVLVILHTFLIQFLIFSYIPAMALFFLVSLYAFITEWIMNKAFNRIKIRNKSI